MNRGTEVFAAGGFKTEVTEGHKSFFETEVTEEHKSGAGEEEFTSCSGSG